MEHFEYDNGFDSRTNKYNSSFFHIFLEGVSPISNSGFNKVDKIDYASFIHEYIHYIQQITTPYGIKYNRYFNNNLILFREYISSTDVISLPVNLVEDIEPARQLELELREKNGSKDFRSGYISDIEINPIDIQRSKDDDTAVNIGVYDFENDKAFENGFQFGYTCVIESMAHLIQSLVNPELFHDKVPYESAQIICDKIRPDLRNDTKLLISICYIALYFNNPGCAFFDILQSVNKNENGTQLFKRYMRDYPRTFLGEEIPNYRMMHKLMDDFLYGLDVLIGNDLIYIKGIIENCKHESSSGESVLLNIIYSGDLGRNQDLMELLNFYGIPAIDSSDNDIVIPFNPDTNRPYIETASLLSLEIISTRLKQIDNKTVCSRYPKCDKISRNYDKDIIDENCAEFQWKKSKSCLFTMGLSYWRMLEKNYE
nr:hypothetical protein [uncultured Draconibacterium sp.]